MLKAQLVLAESTIEKAEHRRQRISARLQSLDLKEMMPEYEVSWKSAEALVVAAIRETIPTPDQIPQRWNTMFTTIADWMKVNRLPVGLLP